MAKADFRLEFEPGEPDRFFTEGEFADNWDRRFQQPVTRSARRRAPRRTGELRNDIAGFTAKDAEGLYSDIGTNLLKGLFQELGHTTPAGEKVAPRRFLRPALRAVRRTARR